MMRIVWQKYWGVALLGLFLTACTGHEKETDRLSGDSTRTDARTETGQHKKPLIVLQDQSLYSEKFIAGLRELDAYEKLELHRHLLIIDEADTAYLPEVPAIGTSVVLKGEKDNLAVLLTIKRINYTVLDYQIELLRNGTPVHRQSGRADIAPTFFFGAESDENEATGEAYLVTEFAEHQSKDCFTYIRLGVEENTGTRLLGKLKKNCNDEVEEITLDNFPVLLQQ